MFLVVMQGVLALSAESENYVATRFGTGIQATSLDSTNLTGKSILLATSGTLNAQTTELIINNGFWDNSINDVVSINSYSISPKSAIIGSTIGIYISALNSQNVWAKIISPNNQEQIVSLINNQTIYYLPNPNILGQYTIIFYANSSSGAIVSIVDHFSLIEEIRSSGGGSTTIIETSCNYDWDCTSWNLCSDGKQTRKCTNIGTCTGSDNKPLEERECSDVLFDVLLKIKDIGSIQNNTIRFSLQLLEQMNAGKIDVNIKYTLIDSNNTEIFRQIETRAVQGNLTYDKEITDINFVPGEYVLRVDILYGNLQRAFTEYKFIVNDKGIVTKLEVKNPLLNLQKFIEPIQTNHIALEILFLVLIVVLILLLLKRTRASVRFNKPSRKGTYDLEYTDVHSKVVEKLGTKVVSEKIVQPPKNYKYDLNNYIVADSSKYFYCNNGQVFKSLADLINGLEIMNITTFNYHVNSSKNDFSNWVIGVFGDLKLSNSIKSFNTREELLHFLKDNTC